MRASGCRPLKPGVREPIHVIALGTIYFYVCAALALTGAMAVTVSKNPIRGAMGLLLLILSVAGLFLALHAQFLAAVQLIVYAGAIVVLFLFVIMLLGPSASTATDQRGIVGRTFGGALFALTGFGALGMVVRAVASGHGAPPSAVPDGAYGGIDAFGSVLFSDAIAPFELSSALLMVAVVGAIAVARGRQGVRSLSKSERVVSYVPGQPGEAVADLGRDHSGVFSHEGGGADASPAAGASQKKEHSA